MIKPSLFVLSELKAMGIGKFYDDALVISIVSPGREHPLLEGKNVFKFHFHDVRQDIELDDGSIVNRMTETIADEIVDVVIKNKDKRVWVIHCEAGISRSPGVAIGLSRFFEFKNTSTFELEKDFPCFNPHIRKLIEGAMIKRIKQEEHIYEIGG